MQTGTKISAIAHVGLIALAVFGGAFRSEPLPFEVREVSVISAEDFAALTAPSAPESLDQSPRPPSRPEPVAETAPDPEPEPDPAPVQPDPVPIPDAPEPEAVVVPEPPAPAPSDRVAPEPVAKPPEDATPGPVEQQEVTADDGAETPQEEQEATAPEQASDRIVTEAEAETEALASLAPLRSPRPPTQRPTPPPPERDPEPDPVAEPEEPEPEEPAPDTTNAVNAALAEALGGDAEPETPTGPPLSAGEKDALRVAVSQCWNVGSLSSEALATTVVVAVSMTQDGKPVTGSIRLLSSSGGSDASARDAFGAARRAIIRCGSSGFDLPAEKYSHWRDIEMTFNPERMRIK